MFCHQGTFEERCYSKHVTSLKDLLLFMCTCIQFFLLLFFREEVNKLKQSDHRRRQIEVHNRKLLLRIQVNIILIQGCNSTYLTDLTNQFLSIFRVKYAQECYIQECRKLYCFLLIFLSSFWFRLNPFFIMVYYYYFSLDKCIKEELDSVCVQLNSVYQLSIQPNNEICKCRFISVSTKYTAAYERLSIIFIIMVFGKTNKKIFSCTYYIIM